MNKYREMKLGQIFATVGCKVVPKGSVLDVIKDGTVVMSGSIDEIRERVAFNCHHHDDPIYYGRSRLSAKDNGKTPATQAKIVAAGQQINEAIDAELPECSDETCEEPDDQAGGSVGREGKKVRHVFGALQENVNLLYPEKSHLRASMAETTKSAKKVRHILPDNRVGALQEMYHADGVIPRYEFKDTGNVPVPPGGYHHCSVLLGELLRWGKGPTKKAAKQDAAGVMLLDIMHGKDPFKKEGHGRKKKNNDPVLGGRGSGAWDRKDPYKAEGHRPSGHGKDKKKNSVPDDWEESYLRKHHAALRYPTNSLTFRYNRNADGWLLRKPKKTKYILKPKTT